HSSIGESPVIGCFAFGVSKVAVSAFLKEQFNNLFIAVEDGAHERRSPFVIPGIDLGPGGDQGPDGSGLSRHNGVRERSLIVHGNPVDIVTRFNKTFYSINVTSSGRSRQLIGPNHAPATTGNA